MRFSAVNVCFCIGLVLLAASAPAADPAFALTSTAFAPNGSIPEKHTCEGKDVSPPLAWSGAPSGTKSFVLIIEDPDASAGTWVHWVVFNLPAGTAGLAAAMKTDHLPAGAEQGRNSWGRTAYGGPCPPSGRHRYVHRLFALDALLSRPKETDAAAIEGAIQGHVLAKTDLVGTYQKTKH